MRDSQTEPSMILYADKTAILYYKAIYSQWELATPAITCKKPQGWRQRHEIR